MRTPSLLESTKYFVLLALASGPLHGYAIRERIIGDTLGIYMRDSTLYSVLKSLVRDDLVEGPFRDSLKPAYTVYQLTDRGKRKLEDESCTLRRATTLAGERLGYRY
jgi:DNA-binding PadR family transcriptional regulator